VLGALLAVLSKEQAQFKQELQCIQSNLFHIGAWLATVPDSPSISALEKITADHSTPLETAMDRMQAELSDLHGFILPGGHITAAWAHVARTVCRRAERHLVALYEHQEHNKTDRQFQNVLLYLNRLSDYLFVLARYCNHLFGEPDMLWEK
jgi:cob(I)alamin adenosyltransferase